MDTASSLPWLPDSLRTSEGILWTIATLGGELAALWLVSILLLCMSGFSIKKLAGVGNRDGYLASGLDQLRKKQVLHPFYHDISQPRGYSLECLVTVA